MGYRKSRRMAEHGLLRYPFLHLRGRVPPSKKQKISNMVFLTDRPTCRLADLRALRQVGLRSIQPYCPQTWQTAILLADAMAIPPFTNHELKL